jgi:dolichyl-phosphate beta-glucosyltransferase
MEHLTQVNNQLKEEIYLSIVVPVYNEENRVEKCISALNAYLSSKNFSSEVIFVDDGSKDKTIDRIKSLTPSFKYQIVSYPANRGKGYAVKLGMQTAAGSYRLFIDADMSTPIEELDKFLPMLDEAKHVLIGTRKSKGARVLKRQPFWRQKLGEVFTLLSNVLVVANVTDFTCGFKIFSATAADTIFRRQRIDRWGFDTEIVFLAAKFGYKIYEVPVVWTNDSATKVNLWKDVGRSLTDLIRIRTNDLRGLYA